MLAAATEYLASISETVTVTGRSKSKLLFLKFNSVKSKHINPVQSDYTFERTFLEDIHNETNKFGKIELAVIWIHSTAPQMSLKIAGMLNETGCKFFHVLGSSFYRPGLLSPDLKGNGFEKLANVEYRRVVLGFKIEDGNSRWLTNDEISEGVIHAIKNDLSLHVIGETEPWEKRP